MITGVNYTALVGIIAATKVTSLSCYRPIVSHLNLQHPFSIIVDPTTMTTTTTTCTPSTGAETRNAKKDSSDIISPRAPRPVLLSWNSKIMRFDMEAEGMAYTDHDPRFDNRQPTQDTDVPVMTNLADIHEDGGVGNSNNNSDEDQGNTNVDSSLITSNQTGMINSGMGSMVSSAHGLHRRRTLYLIRHGEATHNVLEKTAQDKARAEAMELGLSPAETHEMMEEARKAVLTDASLRDAPLTDEGRKQAREAAALLEQMVSEGKAHPPTEAMCSPLTRCLQTCQILLQQYEIRAHVRLELQERQTLYPPDTPKPLNELMKKIRTESFNEEGIDGGQDSNCSPGRFILNEKDWKTSAEDAEEEAQCRESKEMLRERASQLFDMLLEMEHRHVLVVSHKGFLRELERGLLQIPEEKSPLFKNCEMRVYRVIFTTGDRSLHHLERLV